MAALLPPFTKKQRGRTEERIGGTAGLGHIHSSTFQREPHSGQLDVSVKTETKEGRVVRCWGVAHGEEGQGKGEGADPSPETQVYTGATCKRWVAQQVARKQPLLLPGHL